MYVVLLTVSEDIMGSLVPGWNWDFEPLAGCSVY